MLYPCLPIISKEIRVGGGGALLKKDTWKKSYIQKMCSLVQIDPRFCKGYLRFGTCCYFYLGDVFCSISISMWQCTNFAQTNIIGYYMRYLLQYITIYRLSTIWKLCADGRVGS